MKYLLEEAQSSGGSTENDRTSLKGTYRYVYLVCIILEYSHSIIQCSTMHRKIWQKGQFHAKRVFFFQPITIQESQASDLVCKQFGPSTSQIS